jgi:NADH dehydrogenase
MLAQMRNSILGHLYPEVDEMQIEIHLVDGGAAVLGPMSEKSHKYAQKALEEMGVKIKLQTLVSDYKDDTVFLNDNTTIGAKTLIWTAGVTGIKIPGIPEALYQRGGRMAVNAFNQAQGIANIWVLGDAAVEMENADFPHGHPQLASVATQQGNHLAHNFKRLSAGKALEPFQYKDKGTMAIIGRGKAVAELTMPSKKTLTGWLAWAAWLFIHLFLLISYRNRLKTMWSWTSAYFSPRRPLGLMVLKRADIERAIPKETK